MKKIKYIILAVIVLTVMIFSACGNEKIDNSTDVENNQNDKTELTDINLYEVAHSIFYAPQYCSIELGYFADEGININLVNAKGADKVMTGLISGDADIGFMGSEASIYVYAEGSPNYAVNFAQLTQRAGNFLVSRTPDSNFSYSSLKGKTVIGGRVGGMPEMVFEYILKNNGINPDKDLTIIKNIDFGSTAAAFAGGTGDYTVEFEPFAASLELDEKGYVVASLGRDSGYVPYTAYCALNNYLDAHPNIIQHFTNAIQRGIDYVNNHSTEEIAKVISPQFKETPMQNLEIIVDRYKTQNTWKEDTVFNEESFELLKDILKASGELSSDVPYNKLVTTKYSVASKNTSH